MQWTIKLKLITIGMLTVLTLATQTFLNLNITNRASAALAELSLGAASVQAEPSELMAGLVDGVRRLAALPGGAPEAVAQSGEMEASLLLLRERLDEMAASTRSRDRKEAILSAGKLLLDLERGIVLDLPRAQANHAGPEGLAPIVDQIAAQAADLELALIKIGLELRPGESPAADDLMDELQSGASASVTLLMVSLIVLTSVIFLLGHTITRPMAQITEAMNRLAKGDPDVEFDLSRRDEVGQMAQALQALKERMAELEAGRR